jgi:hypothetical protein
LFDAESGHVPSPAARIDGGVGFAGTSALPRFYHPAPEASWLPLRLSF